MKNKFFTILIMLLLPLSVVAVDENIVPIDEPAFVEQTANSSEDFHSQEIDDIQNLLPETENQSIKESSNILPHKQPISKRKLLKKFLLAMIIVGIVPIVLFSYRTIYKKFKEDSFAQIKTPNGKTPLSEPADLEDAVDIFLDKTKWA